MLLKFFGYHKLLGHVVSQIKFHFFAIIYYKEKVMPSVEDTISNFNEYLSFIEKFINENLSSDYKKLNTKKIDELNLKISETLDMYDDFKKKEGVKAW